MQDIAIIGGGFSGAMVLAHLVRHAPALRIALIDDSPHCPRGAAYSTTHPEHLLNVPAARMGAFAEDAEGFHRWLLAEGHSYGPSDFVPRMLYGDYLASLHADTLARGEHISLFHARALSITTGDVHRITLSDGSVCEAKQVVLATGNPFPGDTAYITQPWRFDYAAITGKSFAAPIVIIGTGLTAVDTFLSLRAHGVKADIVFRSRHGHFPQPHSIDSKTISLSPSMFEGLPLSAMLYRLRHIAREVMAAGHSWQAAIDALRPHTQALWQQLPLPEKRRFLKRLRHYWDIHRHRMAPSIHATLQVALARGEARVMRGAVASGEAIDAALVFDCTGPRHFVQAYPLLAPLLEAGILSASPTGLGLQAEDGYRVSRAGAAPIYAIGPLLMGQWFESTAVPELRVQAAALAALLVSK